MPYAIFLNNLNYKGFIILRSTVPVGTCDRLNCFFMPEFLTEVSYINDFINNPDWIFGMLDNNNDFIEFITELINMAFKNKCIKYNNIHFTSNSEAEMIKMFRNCYLANKISFCNEIYQYCSKVNVNYNTVKELVVKDKRIGSSHTNVPGHDGKKGYGLKQARRCHSAIAPQGARNGCDTNDPIALSTKPPCI